MSHIVANRWRIATFVCTLIGVTQVFHAESLGAAFQEAAKSTRLSHLIRVKLPIDDLVSREVRQSLTRIAEKAPASVRPEDRPLVVLEFDTASGKTGRGSEREACQALALELVGGRLNGIETVAYIPKSNSVVADSAAPGAKGSLMGHAVLVAIAANQLAMDRGTSIGNAGADEARANKLSRTVYETISESRLTLPLPVVMSMLEPQRELLRVLQAGKSAVYADQQQLDEILKTASVDDVKTLSKPGEPLMMSAESLKEFRLIKWMPESKNELASLLNVTLSSLESDPTDGKGWKAIQVSLPFLVDDQSKSWMIQNINARVQDGANLVIIKIDECEGNVDACIELAQRLADFKKREVRTVAFVRGKTRGPVAVVALACDHLIMTPSATLGGREIDTDVEVTPEERTRWISLLQNVAKSSEKDWSMLLAMLDPATNVTNYREVSTGQTRLLCNEEYQALKDPEKWAARFPLDMSEGMEAATAEQLSVARLVAEDMGQIQTFYQLESSPEAIELMASDRLLDRFAQFLRRPIISMLLLMATFVFASKEMSAPGMGVPGFLAMLCVSLFFWSMYLGGNAQWFEILMFFIGAICIALEIFVIPGFGIFGIGGVVLVGLSLVLSAQSFAYGVPTTVAEIRQLPYTLMPVLGAGIGLVAGVWLVGKALPNSPFFRKFMIDIPEREVTGLESRSDPEAMVDWSFLLGKTGDAATRLNPSGKVKIRGKLYDAISTGQLIDKGVRIVVVEAVANRVVVKAEESDV